MKVFISYSGDSPAFADNVAQLCRDNGHEAWVAHRATPTRGRWSSELCRQIDGCDAFALCLDPSSLSATFQQYEWQYAIGRDNPPVIVVFRSDDSNETYNNPDAFPFLRNYNYYHIEDEEDRKRAMVTLRPGHEERFQFMQDLVIQAGIQLMLKYGLRFLRGKPKPLDDRKNYSTQIDRDVEFHIIRRIEDKYPQDSIRSEEFYSERKAKNAETEFVWTVDALDGTLNFVSGDDRFCCGVGLVYQNRPYMGAILVPSRMELYTGGEGRVAQRRFLLEDSVESIQSEESICELSECHTLTHVNSEAENIDKCFKGTFPKHLHRAVRRVWMWGCGLVSVLAVSRGSHHLLVQRVTYPHDCVPGLAILRASGGVDSTWPCKLPEPWTLNKWETNEGIVAACNEKVLKAFFEEFGGMA